MTAVNPTAGAGEHSFILMKPDALASDDICRSVYALLRETGLCVGDGSDIRLSKQDIDALWPQYADATHPMTCQLLQLYLEGQRLRVIPVTGPGAISACKALKAEVRGRYAQGAFSNCVHTPADEDESTSQLDHMRAANGAGAVEAGRVGAAPLPGVWGRLAQEGAGRLRQCGLKVWQRAQEAGWDRIWVGSHGNGPCEAVLVTDEVNTLDYAASCIAEVYADWTPEDCLAAVIESDRSASVRLRRGSRAEVDQVAKKLRDFGLACDPGIDAATRESPTGPRGAEVPVASRAVSR